MSQIKDFTSGNILSQLVKLAIPVILTSFVQMSYNLMDMMWLGKLGSSVVSAVGTAFYLIWFGRSLVFFTKIGGEVNIAQAIGRGDRKDAKRFSRIANTTALFVGILYAGIILCFTKEVVGFYGITSPLINQTAIDYLQIIALTFPVSFISFSLTGLYNGVGDTKTPLLVTSIGLGINLLLDPILIFGLGPIPAMGAEGAAWATAFSHCVVLAAFLYLLYTKGPFPNTTNYFAKIQCFGRENFKHIKAILKVGGPLSLQFMLFSGIMMYIAKIVVDVADGDGRPLSVQSIGAQIEALSWMTASGLATALGSFVGQNFGADRWDRIRAGFFMTLKIGFALGIFNMLLFIFAGDFIFSLFIDHEPEILNLGVVYLLIIAIAQVFMCIEIVSSGAFNGIGKSLPVALSGVVFNGLRIPLALLLSGSLACYLPSFSDYISATFVPITGIWWAFTVSSICKGMVLFFGFLWLLKRKHPV